MLTIGWGTGSGAQTQLPWADNCSLSGTTVADGQVRLAWQTVAAQSDTYLLADFETAPTGEVADGADFPAYGNNTLTARVVRAGGLTIADCGLRRGVTQDGSTSYLWHRLGTPLWAASSFGARCHLRLDGHVSERFALNGGNAAWGVGWDAWGRLYVEVLSRRLTTTEAVVPGTWHDVACQYDHLQSAMRLWVDGVCVGSLWGATAAWVTYPSSASQLFVAGGDRPDASGMSLDTLELWQGVRYAEASDLAPRRFLPLTGEIVTTNNPQAGTLTQVEWSAVSGEGNAGRIHQVQVLSGGCWVPVGDDNPTSPLIDLNLPASAGDLLKFVLLPSSDPLATQTPLLTWAKATLLPPAPPPSSRVVRVDQSLYREPVTDRLYRPVQNAELAPVSSAMDVR